MFSFAHGMTTFPEAIAAQLKERVQLGCEVHNVSSSGGFTISYRNDTGEHTVTADAVIVATPASVAGRIVASLSGPLPSKLDAIYYPPVAEVFLGFRSEQINRPLDGFGYLIPAKEKRKILGTIWSSVLFPNRAPEGHAALTSFVGGSRQPELFELDDEKLIQTVTQELQSIMSVNGTPVFSKVIRWQKAIPQYNL